VLILTYPDDFLDQLNNAIERITEKCNYYTEYFSMIIICIPPKHQPISNSLDLTDLSVFTIGIVSNIGMEELKTNVNKIIYNHRIVKRYRIIILICHLLI
jgi:hypothetical protein